MSEYKNGFIPKDKLVRRGSSFYATPGTWAKWDALVADVKADTGITLRITPGNNAYRDYQSQVEAKKEHGSNAAFPGTSSHGGVFKGKDALAIDVDNWMQIGRQRFYNYCLKHGFEPGYFDWEPWHIIDWEPWRAVAPQPPTPAPETEPEEEEEAMDFVNIAGKAGSHRAGLFGIYRGNKDGVLYARRLTFDTLSPLVPTLDNEALTNMKKAVSFIDLV